jgi:type IV pilus assembly protein PilC
MNYRYQVRNSAGQVQSGSLSAESASGAAAALRAQGLHVMSLSMIAGNEGGGGLMEKLRDLNAGKPNQRHVLDFTTQLAVMIRAGINLRAALDGIAEQTQHRGFQKVIQQLKNDVEGGKQFSEAIAKHPKLFNPL